MSQHALCALVNISCSNLIEQIRTCTLVSHGKELHSPRFRQRKSGARCSLFKQQLDPNRHLAVTPALLCSICVCSTFELTACTECAHAVACSDKVDDKLFNKRSASKPKAVVTKALAGSANPIWQTPQLSVRLAQQARCSRRRQSSLCICI